MRARRRRGLLLLSLALASGGLAAVQVRERERGVEERVGPLVPVVVAKRGIPADEPLQPAQLAIARVPARFVPPDALGAPGRLAGARTAVPVAAGGYLTAGLLQGAASGGEGGPLRPGQRAVEVAVAGGSALAGAGPGSRVDVLVSTQRREGAGRTFVALEDAELLELRHTSADAFAGEPSADGPAPTALATLRVTLRQAVYLATAESFGHGVRLLVRPPGDRRRVGTAAVAEGEL
jgi:pilus assembly protein CpaB